MKVKCHSCKKKYNPDTEDGCSLNNKPFCENCSRKKEHLKYAKEYAKEFKKNFKNKNEELSEILQTNIMNVTGEPFLSPRCGKCGNNPATEDHACPYAEDINGDSETLCNCCADCCQDCADDI